MSERSVGVHLADGWGTVIERCVARGCRGVRSEVSA